MERAGGSCRRGDGRGLARHTPGPSRRQDVSYLTTRHGLGTAPLRGLWHERRRHRPGRPRPQRLHLRCTAVLGECRVESRASGEASSVMAGAEVGGWSVPGCGRLGAGRLSGALRWWALGPVDYRSVRTASSKADTTISAACRHCRSGHVALRVAAAPRPCPAGPTVGGSTVDACHAAPAWPCPPAWWVGRSPATRPRAVTPGDPPEDAPARGDQHRVRLGVRQGPQVQLLAQARRRPSLHPEDLRPALPGVPHPRPAVLQPRRPTVSGARQRAAGGRAEAAVAGQGDDEGRHRPTSSGPWR